MKHILSLLAAVILIAGVYIYQFGLPFSFSSSSDAGNRASVGGAQNAGPRAGGSQRPSGPGGPGGGRRSAGATYVTTASILVQSYADSYSAIGTGVAQQSVSLVSEVSGQIRDVLFSGTPKVEKGDVLIQLDDESQKISVEIAQANLAAAQDTLDRYEILRARNSGVVADATLKEAEANVAVAKGNLALAEVTLKNRAIRAPINGKLGLIDLEVGDYLSNGAKIVNINNTETILVSFELPERAISVLALDKTVRVTTPAKPGAIFEGKIVAFDSVIDETTRTITVKAAIENPDSHLWPGMTFNVALHEISAPLASLPAIALTWSREGTQVWVEENGTVKAVPVTFRKRIDDTVWIEGELAAGTKVVVDGVQKLRAGAKVTVTGEASGGTTRFSPDADGGESAQ